MAETNPENSPQRETSPRVDRGKGPAHSNESSGRSEDNMTPAELKLYNKLEKKRLESEKEMKSQMQLILDALNKETGKGPEGREERERIHETGPRGTTRSGTYKDFKTCSPLTYAGSDGDPVKLLEWITNVETAFSLADTPESHKVKYAASLLTAGAMMWWKSVVNSFPAELISSFTWEQFKIQIKGKYCTEDMTDELEKKLLEFKQGSLSVTEYEVEFTRLCLLADYMVSTESRKIKRFVDGLEPKIRKVLIHKTFDSYHKVVEKARVVEREVNRSKALKSSVASSIPSFVPSAPKM